MCYVPVRKYVRRFRALAAASLIAGSFLFCRPPASAGRPMSPAAYGSLLGPPSGGGLNAARDATPTAIDINNSADFVRQHYLDFLNREPDAPGLAFWVNEVEKCGADIQCRGAKRINVSAAFFLSIEFQETGYLAYRTYKVAYGDAQGFYRDGGGGVHPLPVPAIRLEEFLADTRRLGEGVIVGQGDWQAQLEAYKTAYFDEFVSRPRFVNGGPATMTPEQFVDARYSNAAVTPTSAQRQAAIDEFAAAPDTADRA